MGREVSIERIRTVIRYLQLSGQARHAGVIWDLLDNYIALNPKLLAMQHVADYEGPPTTDVFGGQGGDSFGTFSDILEAPAPPAFTPTLPNIQAPTPPAAPANQELRWTTRGSERPTRPNSLTPMPKCAVSSFHAAAMDCPNGATGYLVRVNVETNVAFPMCTKHGEMFNREGYAEWVQTLFGDEDGTYGAHSAYGAVG